MRNLSVMEQKQVVGGYRYKVFYKDGTYMAYGDDLNTLLNYYGCSGGQYHFLEIENGRVVRDWWE